MKESSRYSRYFPATKCILLKHKDTPITGFQCHAIQNRSKKKIKPVQQIKSDQNQKIEDKHTKTLPKIQVTAIFPEQDMQRDFFTQIYRDLHGDAMLVPVQMGVWKQKETSVTEFCYKRVNLSFEELKT